MWLIDRQTVQRDRLRVVNRPDYKMLATDVHKWPAGVLTTSDTSPTHSAAMDLYNLGEIYGCMGGPGCPGL